MQLKMGDDFCDVPPPPNFVKLCKTGKFVKPSSGWKQALEGMPADLAKRVEHARKLEELHANWWRKSFKMASQLDHLTLVLDHDFRDEYAPRYLQRGVKLEMEVGYSVYLHGRLIDHSDDL